MPWPWTRGKTGKHAKYGVKSHDPGAEALLNPQNSKTRASAEPVVKNIDLLICYSGSSARILWRERYRDGAIRETFTSLSSKYNLTEDAMIKVQTAKPSSASAQLNTWCKTSGILEVKSDGSGEVRIKNSIRPLADKEMAKLNVLGLQTRTRTATPQATPRSSFEGHRRHETHGLFD